MLEVLLAQAVKCSILILSIRNHPMTDTFPNELSCFYPSLGSIHNHIKSGHRIGVPSPYTDHLDCTST